LEQSSEKTEEALIKLEDASKRTLKAVAESGKNTMDSLKQIEAIRNKLGDDQNLVGVIVLKGEDDTPKPKSEQE
jgi:hypothetical protein